MHIAAMFTAALIIALAGGSPPTARAEDARPAGTCALTPADKLTNAKMSFDDFDQAGAGPATWRQLSNHKCWPAALEAAEDYLVHARFKTPSEQRDVIFHIAQTLGEMGENDEAALVVAGAKNTASYSGEGLDWNTYVDGTWAFFKHDRAALERAQTTLISESGPENRLDGSVLTGLLHCFDQSYRTAYEKACRN